MAAKLAYHANCWGAARRQRRRRHLHHASSPIAPSATWSRRSGEIGEAGYAGTELFDGNLLDYEGRYGELRSVLNQAGVSLVAAYSGANFIFDDILGEELARIERAAAAAAELGAEHLVVGGGAKRAKGREPDDFKRLGAALDKVVDIARKARPDRALSSASIDHRRGAGGGPRDLPPHRDSISAPTLRTLPRPAAIQPRRSASSATASATCT